MAYAHIAKGLGPSGVVLIPPNPARPRRSEDLARTIDNSCNLFITYQWRLRPEARYPYLTARRRIPVMDELQLVSWLQQRAAKSDARPAVALGIGDDMAAIAARAELILVSSDMLLDGVHFDLARHDPSLVGRKAIACSLSDCAAMAVRPIALTVSIALPKSLDRETVEQIFEGMFTLADEFDVPLAGGDTTRWDHPLALDVAVTAVPHDGIDPVTRSGAKPGDTLFVTGKLGGSLAKRHLTFTPRVKEAEAIARRLGGRLHAMIDISDGLSLDLWRVCEASGVGAVLDERLLQAVMSHDAQVASEQDGSPALDHVLSDGEDFELLLAVNGPVDASDIPLFEIGRVTDGGLAIRKGDGSTAPLTPRGFVH